MEYPVLHLQVLPLWSAAKGLQLEHPFGRVVVQVLQVLSQGWQTPFKSMTNPPLQLQVLGLIPFKTPLALQLVHPLAFEFEQVLHVIWQPAKTQFPFELSSAYPVAQMHCPLCCRSEFVLHEVQPVLVGLLQVKQVLWQVIELQAPVAELYEKPFIHVQLLSA